MTVTGDPALPAAAAPLVAVTGCSADVGGRSRLRRCDGGEGLFAKLSAITDALFAGDFTCAVVATDR